MAEGYKQAGIWKSEDKTWEEPGMLEEKLSSAKNYFSRITYGPGLNDAISALYMAEAVPAENAALKETTYVAALLGFEGYIGRMKQEMSQSGKRDEVVEISPEAERYLDICNQLSDYCRSKVGYLNQDAPKENGHTKA
jgi:hypothetical protein